MNETRGQRDITQEFSLRSKLRDIHHAHKVIYSYTIYCHFYKFFKNSFIGMGPTSRTAKGNRGETARA
jgi:hypothetical protein